MPNEELISLSEKLEQLIDDAQNSHWHAKFAAQEATANELQEKVLETLLSYQQKISQRCSDVELSI